MSGPGQRNDHPQLGPYNNGVQPQQQHPYYQQQYQPHFAQSHPQAPAASSGIKLKLNFSRGGGGSASSPKEASPAPLPPQYPQTGFHALSAAAYPQAIPQSQPSYPPLPQSQALSQGQIYPPYQPSPSYSNDMARLSSRNSAPANDDSGRPARTRNNLNYNVDKLTQYSNPAVAIQQGNNLAGPSTRRSSGSARANGAVKAEDDDEAYIEDDADGSFDDDGEEDYGSRKKAGSKAPARGGGKGKGKNRGPPPGSKAAPKRRSGGYKNEDDEDDFVAPDEDEDADFDEEDESGDLGSTKLPPGRAGTKAKHPNLARLSDSSDEDRPLAADTTRSQYVQGTVSRRPPATQFVPDSEADAHYVVPGSISGNGRRASQQMVPAHQLLFSEDAGLGNGPIQPNAAHRRRVADSEDEQDAEGESELASEGYVVAGVPRQQQQQAMLAVPQVKVETYQTGSGRHTRKAIVESEAEDEPLSAKKKAQSRSDRKYLGNGSDSADDYSDDEVAYATRRKAAPRKTRFAGRVTRNSRRAAADDDDEEYEETSRRRPSSSDDDDIELILTDAESQDELMFEGRKGKDGKNYRLRKRSQPVNYNLPAMFGLNPDGTPAAPVPGSSKTDGGSAKKGKKKRSVYGGPKHLPFNMSGKQLGSLFGEQYDSSSDDDANTPRRPAGGLLGAGAMSTGGMPMDFASGTPANFGKISGATNLADIDPLLPSTQLSFDSVGGLQSHIQQLKEMVSLPLLYPEVFQRFGITPPRGVLFHGPPGTGKTLLARALAASCSSQGQKISFFMRKGADVLSKWVGEAERQLRLLFEEAKNSQPSIIFFDEIDGLAPVRSSKQDQIHASIVSTLLALMDGMDGRGQVIVIGATNRPDAVDPALRRPGRFDREFYFPLPDLEARRKIIEINTKKWEPPIRPEFLDELAHLTKGYGGADLRALCTEAALNAVQRKYPQIYKTTDRLLIKPEEIDVIARDFIISAKNLIPSTARSTSALASALPPHLEPLLRQNLDRAISSLSKIMPEVKKINVLEEAQYEPLGDGGFEQERLTQTFEKLRVYKPRLILAGGQGMGQKFIGPAILHHLEGFHVQSLDLATLNGDSARTADAAVVQIFNEAKRHKPSILYIPSLISWSNAVGESVKNTIGELLDSLDPSDPILLLAIAQGPLSAIDRDIRSWFGFLKNNRVVLEAPSLEQRSAFFEETLTAIQREPTSYPDAMPRRKRVLEQLPIAPPLAPREPTAAELQQQEQADARLREYLKFRLGPINAELKRKYKRFCKHVGEPGEKVEFFPPGTEPPPEDGERGQDVDAEAGEGIPMAHQAVQAETEPAIPSAGSSNASYTNGHSEDHAMANADGNAEANVGVEPTSEADQTMQAVAAEPADSAATATADATVAAAAQPPKQQPKTLFFVFHDISLDKIEMKIYSDKYVGPEPFLADIEKVVENAYADGEEEVINKADQLLNTARIMVDQQCDLSFRQECAKMAAREKDRAKARAEKKQKAKDAKAAAAGNVAPEATELSASSSTLKRPLDNSDDGETTKRQRMDSDMLDATTAANTAINGQSSSAIGRSAIIPESPSPFLGDRSASKALVNGNATSASIALTGRPSFPTLSGQSASLSAATRTVQPAAPPGISSSLIGEAILPASAPGTRPASPEPEPHPPFYVPHEELKQLSAFLEKHTLDLTVDELEQLRAACYDAIWRARRDWDKSNLVKEIYEMANEFVEELEDSKRGE